MIAILALLASQVCADLQLELVQTSSRAAHWQAAAEQWKHAAIKEGEAAKRWEAVAAKRAVRKESVDAKLERSDIQVRRLEIAVVEAPPPVVVRELPWWVGPAIAGGVVGAGGGAYFGARAVGNAPELGASVGAVVGGVGLGAIVASIPILFEWIVGE